MEPLRTIENKMKNFFIEHCKEKQMIFSMPNKANSIALRLLKKLKSY